MARRGLLDGLTPEDSGQRDAIDDGGGESAAAASWLFAMLATGTAPVLRGSIKSSTRACGAVSSARASAIDLRELMLCCGETIVVASADAESDAAGVGVDSFGAARAALFFASPMYQQLRLAV